MSGTTTRLFETQVPVTCGGVDIRPGEIVFGDGDGLVVASEEQFAQVIPDAENIQRNEEHSLEQMANGKSLFDLLNFHRHVDAIRNGQESRLAFG